MDSLFFENGLYGSDFKSLLTINGSFVHKWRFKKVVSIATEFYDAYVKKCQEYQTYMDFFTPLRYHLMCCGIGIGKINEYFTEIRGKIITNLSEKLPKDVLEKIISREG